MDSKQYFKLGENNSGYHPETRYQFLKDNFQSLAILNGHTLYIKLKNGETLELCDTGFSASFPLLDFCILVNEMKQGE